MGAIYQKFTGPGTFPVAISAENGSANLNQIHIDVDTTGGAVILQLPSIASIGNAAGNVEIDIFDKGGAATSHNITITADAADKVNNAASIILSTNKGTIEMEVSSETDNTWAAELVSSSGGLSKFAAFWQTVADVAGTIAANNGKVLFHTPSSNNAADITTVADSGDITIGAGAGGKYMINWSVSGAEANAFAIFINGVLTTGTLFGSGAVTQQNSGFAILTLAAADVVSLRSVSCAAPITLQLAGTTDVRQNVAAITFEKIG